MAAVIVPITSDPTRRVEPGRAPLRVIDGGRSAAQLARRRLYRRRRLLALAVVSAVAALLWLAVLGALSLTRAGTAGQSTSAATAAETPVAAEEYVVQPGDTLWTIARRLRPSGDVRPVVDELADRAGGAALQVGQRIDVRGLDG